MPRSPSIQWYYKQWLGDNKVLAMDWDAQGMHFHLLMMSIQEEPPGSIPDDMAVIRRWLRLPSGQSESDRAWARVQPQIFAAWSFRDKRWFNEGMVQTFIRKEKYNNRYENGTKSVPERYEKIPKSAVDVNSISIQDFVLSLDEATQMLFLELHITGIQNRIKCEEAIKSYVYWAKCSEKEAAERLVESWNHYQALDSKYKTHAIGFLERGLWAQEDTWTKQKSELSTGGW